MHKRQTSSDSLKWGSQRNITRRHTEWCTVSATPTCATVLTARSLLKIEQPRIAKWKSELTFPRFLCDHSERGIRRTRQPLICIYNSTWQQLAVFLESPSGMVAKNAGFVSYKQIAIGLQHNEQEFVASERLFASLFGSNGLCLGN